MPGFTEFVKMLALQERLSAIASDYGIEVVALQRYEGSLMLTLSYCQGRRVYTGMMMVDYPKRTPSDRQLTDWCQQAACCLACLPDATTKLRPNTYDPSPAPANRV